MQTRTRLRTLVPSLPSTLLWVAVSLCATTAMANEPLQIDSQGSFLAGGTTKKESGTFDPLKPSNPDGQSYHGDHVYAFYQKPVDIDTLGLIVSRAFHVQALEKESARLAARA